jgi:hypothetical protein
MQEAAEHARFRALMQTLQNTASAKTAFDEYMAVAFPYLASTKRQEVENVAKILQQEVSRGPISIRRLDDGKSKLRNVTQIVRKKLTPKAGSVDAILKNTSLTSSLEGRLK